MLLDIHKHILQNKDFSDVLKKRGRDIDIAKLEVLYKNFTIAQQNYDDLASELNRMSKNFNKENLEKMTELSNKKDQISETMRNAKNAYENYMLHIPNLLHEDTKTGEDARENIEIYRNKDPITKSNQHHDEILSEYLLRGEATTMSGSKFIAMRGKLATLERKLINKVLDTCISNGFIEMSVPALVKPHAMLYTGQLPKFTNDFFMTEEHCLIPTGEVPLANLYAKKTIKSDELPIKMTAVTPCFRKESGSLGRDTRGMIRVHQFNKVEMLAICTPAQSEEMHQYLLEISKNIVQDLGLPYRVMSICSGDIGFSAAKQYDIEVWMPGQGKYVEVASISNCWDFQARRMQLKYMENKKKYLAHTLNATALAPGRIIAGLAENNMLDDWIAP